MQISSTFPQLNIKQPSRKAKAQKDDPDVPPHPDVKKSPSKAKLKFPKAKGGGPSVQGGQSIRTVQHGNLRTRREIAHKKAQDSR